MISLIFAMGRNREFGLNNRLPWHLPADLQYFKKTTMGHPVLMGRKTFESIGKPLPGRTNLVLTRDKAFRADGVQVIHSLEDVIGVWGEDKELFVIGGIEVFKAALPYADRMYMTWIDGDFEADTFFPAVREEDWRLLSSEPGVVDEKNHYPHEFRIYERVR